MSRDLTRELTEIAQRMSAAAGVDLYWLTWRHGGAHSVVTVYIDKPGGVTVDDCARLSRALETPFDEKIEGRYNLEVSSPGLDRELHVLAHYQGALGETIQLKLNPPWNRQSVLVGQLQGLSEHEIVLDLRNEQTIHIPLAQVQRAKVVASL